MAKKSTRQMMPEQIYVVRAYDGDDTYLTASEGIEDIDDTDVVGVYELIRTARKQVEHTLLY